MSASFANQGDVLAAAAAAGAFDVIAPGSTRSAEGNAIRPFNINVPEETLVDLRRRMDAMKA
jgi:hypothetical protein